MLRQSSYINVHNLKTTAGNTRSWGEESASSSHQIFNVRGKSRLAVAIKIFNLRVKTSLQPKQIPHVKHEHYVYASSPAIQTYTLRHDVNTGPVRVKLLTDVRKTLLGIPKKPSLLVRVYALRVLTNHVLENRNGVVVEQNVEPEEFLDVFRYQGVPQSRASLRL